MKNQIIMASLLWAVSIASLAQTNSLDSFVSSVNTAWQQTNHTQIVQLVNQRLAGNSNDVAALCVNAYYNVFVDGNLTNARTAVDQFNAVVQQSSNTDARAIGQGMRDEIYGVPLTESGSQTQAQLDQMHHELPDAFPMIAKCRWLAIKTVAP